MECPGGNKQDVIGPHHAVLRVHGASFDEWQQVSLHALTRHIRTDGFRPTGDFVDLIEKDDAVLFDSIQRAGF